jgi:hypothetical protein
MPILKIWHKKKHEDCTVTTRVVKDHIVWVAECHRQGGFWATVEYEEGECFIPWHSISFIGIAEEET